MNLGGLFKSFPSMFRKVRYTFDFRALNMDLNPIAVALTDVR